MKKTLSIPIYALLTTILYGAIFSGMLLGFLNIYKPFLVIIASLLTTVFTFWLYLRSSGSDFFQNVLIHSSTNDRKHLLDMMLYAAGTLLFALLILLPVIRWPASVITDWFPFDAAKYHFPKAIEMVAT